MPRARSSSDRPRAGGDGFRAIDGTAVCVIRGGLFATHDHTVSGARGKATVKLVLNPGASDQRIVAARLIEIDEAIDLALLEADIKPLPQPVEVAPDQDLHPDMRVTRLRLPRPVRHPAATPGSHRREIASSP